MLKACIAAELRTRQFTSVLLSSLESSFGPCPRAVIGAGADLLAAFPQERCTRLPMRLGIANCEADRMDTYAVYWKELDGARFAGRISLGGGFAELEGGAGDGRHMRRRIRFDEIASVRYTRGCLHVWRRCGAPLRFGSVDRPGALRELAERIQSQLGTA
jgi:hypothetical protein